MELCCNRNVIRWIYGVICAAGLFSVVSTWNKVDLTMVKGAIATCLGGVKPTVVSGLPHQGGGERGHSDIFSFMESYLQHLIR